MNSARRRRYFEFSNFNFTRFSLILDVFLVQNKLLYSIRSQCTVFAVRIWCVGAHGVASPWQFRAKTPGKRCIHPAKSCRGRRGHREELRGCTTQLTVPNEGIFAFVAVHWEAERPAANHQVRSQMTQNHDVKVNRSRWFSCTSTKHLPNTSHTQGKCLESISSDVPSWSNSQCSWLDSLGTRWAGSEGKLPG